MRPVDLFDAGRDCPHCSTPMRFDIGAADVQPPFGGALDVEQATVCPGCGYEPPILPLLDDETIRRRVRRVLDHNAVCDGRCVPGAPCRASRPGIPAVALKAVA